MIDRFYKENKTPPSIDTQNTFLLADSNQWNKPYILSIEKIGQSLEIKINEDIQNKFKEDLNLRNVFSVEFTLQDQFPELPPGSFPVSEKTHIAVDENYLYVWVFKVNRWKRILLVDI